MKGDTSDYDVTIVGGGIIGLSIGYHLTKAGKKVILIDADHKGKATKAGAGIISAATSFTEDETLYSFLMKSSQYYLEIVKELEYQTGTSSSYESSEEVVVTYHEDQIPQYQEAITRIFDRQKTYDYPPDNTLYEMPIDEFQTRFPDLTPPKKVLYFAEAGKIDGNMFALCLLDAALGLGLETIHGTVSGLSINALGECEGVLLKKTPIKSQITIIAGGAWSKTFEDQLGIILPLYPQRGQIAHLRIKETKQRIPIIISLSDYYSLNWGNEHLVVGATREDESGYIPKNTVKGVQEVLRQGVQMIPEVANAEILDIKVGLRPYSLDKLPIIGPIEAITGLWVATGHGPLGLTSAPYTGKIICEAIVEDKFSKFIQKFSPSRFKNQ